MREQVKRGEDVAVREAVTDSKGAVIDREDTVSDSEEAVIDRQSVIDREGGYDWQGGRL